MRWWNVTTTAYIHSYNHTTSSDEPVDNVYTKIQGDYLILNCSNNICT